MLFITVPVGYLCGIVLEMGIPGLMIGFGCQGLALCITYSIILLRLDWVKVALEAHRSAIEEG
jgi:Na+-driven multidrug efflux pump